MYMYMYMYVYIYIYMHTRTSIGGSFDLSWFWSLSDDSPPDKGRLPDFSTRDSYLVARILWNGFIQSSRRQRVLWVGNRRDRSEGVHQFCPNAIHRGALVSIAEAVHVYSGARSSFAQEAGHTEPRMHPASPSHAWRWARWKKAGYWIADRRSYNWVPPEFPARLLRTLQTWKKAAGVKYCAKTRRHQVGRSYELWDSAAAWSDGQFRCSRESGANKYKQPQPRKSHMRKRHVAHGGQLVATCVGEHGRAWMGPMNGYGYRGVERPGQDALGAAQRQMGFISQPRLCQPQRADPTYRQEARCKPQGLTPTYRREASITTITITITSIISISMQYRREACFRSQPRLCQPRRADPDLLAGGVLQPRRVDPNLPAGGEYYDYYYYYY